MTIRQSGFKDTKANSGAYGGNFPLIPEGEYRVVVKKVEETEAKTSGNPMVKVRWMILDEGNFLGKLIFDQIVFCESMAGRNKHVLKVLGQPYEEQKGEEELEIDPDEWVGKPARVVVIHETYEGKERAKVSQYLYKDEESEKAAHDKGSAKPSSKPAPAAKKKEEPAPAESAENDNPPVGEDDETIPF